jgi:hypothetical protein
MWRNQFACFVILEHTLYQVLQVVLFVVLGNSPLWVHPFAQTVQAALSPRSTDLQIAQVVFRDLSLQHLGPPVVAVAALALIKRPLEHPVVLPALRGHTVHWRLQCAPAALLVPRLLEGHQPVRRVQPANIRSSQVASRARWELSPQVAALQLAPYALGGHLPQQLLYQFVPIAPQELIRQLRPQAASAVLSASTKQLQGKVFA